MKLELPGLAAVMRISNRQCDSSKERRMNWSGDIFRARFKARVEFWRAEDALL